jgi:hypothetical protein
MDATRIISETVNWNTIIGKIIWAVIAMILRWLWNKSKSIEIQTKRTICLGVTFIVAVVMLLTLIGQMVGRQNLGFQAMLLGAGQTYMVQSNDILTNASQLPSNTIGAATPTAPDADGFNLEMILRIVNAGETSVAWNWRAFYVLPGSKEQVPTLIPSYFAISSPGPVMTPFGALHVTSENNLVQSLVTTSLPRGQAVVGWVIIHVNGIKTLPWGTRFILTFEDAFRQETRVDYVWQPPVK